MTMAYNVSKKINKFFNHQPLSIQTLKGCNSVFSICTKLGSIHPWLNHDLKMPIEKAQEWWNQSQPVEHVLSPAPKVARPFGREVFV